VEAPAGDPRRQTSDEVEAYRFVRKAHLHRNVEPFVPGSGEFSDSSDGSGMSVFLRDEMDKAGKTWREIEAAIFPTEVGQRVPCVLTLGQLREHGQDVVRESIDEFPGHAEVLDSRGKRSTGTRSKLAKAARWPDDIRPDEFDRPQDD
jgi:hypothetical protein